MIGTENERKVPWSRCAADFPAFPSETAACLHQLKPAYNDNM